MIILPLRLPSDNEIWGFANGKRYKTAVYKQFEHDAGWLLKAHSRSFKAGDRLKVSVTLYWQNAGLRDASNALKCLGDILSKSQIIPDDRYIWEWEVKKVKIPRTQDEYCEITIEEIGAKDKALVKIPAAVS